MAPNTMRRLFYPAILLGSLASNALADNTLRTNGFVPCTENPTVKVEKMQIQYNRDTRQITFDVAGTSNKVQNVTAVLDFYAYGNNVYHKAFNPCNPASFVDQLCPLPQGTFSASGVQTIPDEYTSMIPSIAFTIPDLDGEGRLALKPIDGGKDLACIKSTVTNGKSTKYPAVQYVAVGIAGASLAMSGVSALAAAGKPPGGATLSPTFTETLGWFQSIAMNGMMSVQYPSVYRSFSQNFAFSTGLVSWDALQERIDGFRLATGGNLTHDNIHYLRNSTLVYASDAQTSKRDIFSRALLYARDVVTNVNGDQNNVGTGNGSTDAADSGKDQNVVSGIQGYVEELSIPQSNTFMTVLLIFAIVIGAIICGILLFKVILETWALFGTFPKKLTGFRKRYWWLLAKTITNLIFALYGVWTLYCVYQFTRGDSWAAKVLAGVTLGLFTVVLAFFTIRIWYFARKSKKAEGDASELFEKKEIWIKYSILYENFKKSYWWLFIPGIIFMFARGCVIAGGDGHGIFQAGGQLIVDSLLLVLLLWSRPYSLGASNWINIVIQVIRVLSVVCILVFVEELGINQTTKTITGYALLITQATLTCVLGILIAINSIIMCVRANPHRRRRKEAEKLNRDVDDLTPLDARNSLLMYPMEKPGFQTHTEEMSMHSRGRSLNGYDQVTHRDSTPVGYRDDTNDHYTYKGHKSARDGSLSGESFSRRQPQLPDIEYRGLAI